MPVLTINGDVIPAKAGIHVKPSRLIFVVWPIVDAGLRRHDGMESI